MEQLAEFGLNHSDETVRASGMIKMAQWAKDAQDLAPLVQMLGDDENRSKTDRINSAIAISQSRVVNDELKETLLSRMNDPDELIEVRRYAAEALRRFKLSGKSFEQFQRFRQEEPSADGHG